MAPNPKTLPVTTVRPAPVDEPWPADAMTQDEIDANADSDPDNPTWSADDTGKAVFARDVRLAREQLGLTQAVFAERFSIGLARLRNWEQGRYAPDSVAVAYVKVIRHCPKVIDASLRPAVLE